MRILMSRALVASTILCHAVAFVGPSSAAGLTPAAASAPTTTFDQAEAEPSQMILTEKQIQGLLAADETIGAIVDKIPEGEMDNPNPRIQARLDKVARQFGFKDYGEYDDVSNNVSFIMDGFNPDTKTFVGHDILLKRQIADVENDKDMDPRDKAAKVRELDDELKAVEPAKYPENANLVGKYYDKLVVILSDDD